MLSNLPISALPIFGPAQSPDGSWGHVPWDKAVDHAEAMEGLKGGSVAVFGSAPHAPVLAVTDSDNDLDGPGGSRQIDPDYLPGTALRHADGSFCDSRVFPGVVISPLLEKLGVGLGDFCLAGWGDAVRAAQVYDIGPTRKAGENSVYLNRHLGLILPSQDDHHAARNGHSTMDVVTLFFPRSGPGHALPPDLIVAATHALWAAFTNRPVPHAS